jgi:hypothetical protein
MMEIPEIVFDDSPFQIRDFNNIISKITIKKEHTPKK